MAHIGRLLIILGIILVILGLIIYFAGNRFSWIGHLPGDIRIERDNIRVYIPITTMILISIVISLIIYLARKLF